jgi:hypothetical protein
MLAGVRALDDPKLADEVEAWLDAHPIPQGAKHIAQSREKLRINVAYRQREAEPLSSRLLAPTGDG